LPRGRLEPHVARIVEITDEDLSEALTAAHAIGDDTLGNSDERKFTHGTSEQRKRWFRRGFDSGDARQCDTFAAGRGPALRPALACRLDDVLAAGHDLRRKGRWRGRRI
jgi:hypothetical protein